MESESDYAQKLLEDLRTSYLHDLPSQFDDIETAVLCLRETEDFQENFEELHRRIHSMKGTAGTYGLHIFTNICHILEDFLNSPDSRLEMRNPVGVQKILAYIDLMRETRELLVSGKTNLAEIEMKLAKLAQSHQTKSRKALLVENSRAIRLLCSQLLEELGYHVVIGSDGRTALDRLLHEKFDLLVCGLEIAELNGQALIAALRLSGKLNSGINAVLISAKQICEVPGVSANVILSRDQNLSTQLIKFVQSIS